MKKTLLFKRVCAASLSALIAASGSALTVFAAELTPDGTIDSRYSYAYRTYAGEGDEVYVADTAADQELIEYVADEILSYKNEIDISSYCIDLKTADALRTAVLNSHPEIFFLRSFTFTPKVVSLDEIYAGTIKVVFQDLDENGDPNAEKINERLQEFYDNANKYLSLASEQLNYCNDDFSKALVLHDEIVQTAHFDSGNDTRNDIFLKGGAGSSRCYSAVYAYLLGQVGIKSEVISTPENGMNHEWVKVCLDGKYYNVDLTRDDPMYIAASADAEPAAEGPDYPARVDHTYFLMSDDYINNLSDPYYGYSSINAADDNKYDNSVFHSYSSKFCKVSKNDKFFYAIDNNSRKLVKYNYETGIVQTVLDLNTALESFEDSFQWVTDEAFSGRSWSNLAECNGYLFFNSPRKVYRFDPATNKLTVMAQRGKLDLKQYFGLKITEGNMVFCLSKAGFNDPVNVSLTRHSAADVLAMPITKVVINPKPAEIKVGDSVRLYPSTVPAGSQDIKTWSSSNSRVATISVSNDEVYLKGVSEGKATITMSAATGVSDSFDVFVLSGKPKVTSFTISPTTVDIGLGRTVQMTYKVLPANSEDVKITWTSSDESIAYIEPNGELLACCPGKAVITATCTNKAGSYTYKATCPVSVHLNVAEKIILSDKVEGTPFTTLYMDPGTEKKLVPTIYPLDTNDKRKSWTCEPSNIAYLTAKGDDIYVVARKQGVATVTVSTQNGKKTTVTVKVLPIEPDSIKLSVASVTAGVGESIPFTATLAPSDVTVKDITYSSNKSNVATVTKSGGKTYITAKAVGTATITAKTKNGKTASCIVVVRAAPSKITMNKTAKTIGVGENYTLKATLPGNTVSNTITWTSSNTSVCTVSQKGKLLGKKAGSAVITVKTFNNKTSTCKVTVKKAPASVTLSKTSKTLGVGEQYTLKATLPSGTASGTMVWSTTNKSVATVSSNGTITANKTGTLYISVRTFNGKTAKCHITVKTAPSKVSINKSAVTLGAGETFQLKATLPSNTASGTMTWTTSNKAVATVSDGKITAVKAGTANITVKTFNGKSAVCKVTVKAAPSKVTLNYKSKTINVGSSYTLKATLPSNTASNAITWTSSNTSVATVSNGAVKGVKKGTATVTVKTFNGKTATCKITVK